MADPETTPAATTTTPPTTIGLRVPSKYLPSTPSPPAPTTTAGAPATAPPLDWLCRTWSVTHSTLSMWRTARNVRITYKPLPPPSPSSLTPSIDDIVEYEKRSAAVGDAPVKRIEGVDKPDGAAPPVGSAWNWRGKGWLRIASSHWEVLGWGERPLGAGSGVGDMGADVERWAVTWFAPTLFTKEGVDIYSDRREGLSKETVDGIMAALKALEGAPKVVQLVEKEMQDIEVKLPWSEKK